MPTHHRAHLIELKLRDLEQLFNTMDPSPFHDKDLDRAAEEFIETWADELPRSGSLELRVHLARWPADDPTALITSAVHSHFLRRAQASQLEFRRLMRVGRTSLVIGLAFLAACLAGAEMTARSASRIAGYAQLSLTIVGWVALWRPLDIYLYDWWPLRERYRLYRRLSEMLVTVVRA
jgi:hypothetical protein